MNLVCIADLAAYTSLGEETPQLFDRLQRESDINLIHVTSDTLPNADTLIGNRVDLVFDRVLKPLPKGYMTRLCKLESQGVRFVNSPKGICHHLHPSFLYNLAGFYLPKTIVTRCRPLIARFLSTGTIVSKEPETCGGKGVHLCTRLEEVDKVLEKTTGDIEWQKYIRCEGDKRVSVIGGKICGAWQRSNPNGWIHTTSHGGIPAAAVVSDWETRVIKSTVSIYATMGIHTLGYDFLQLKNGSSVLSEINAGNIGGYAIQEQVNGPGVYQELIDFLIKKGMSDE